MEAPAIHYDTILGANPVWKSCISEGLKGNLRPFGREELILSHGTPSGVYFLHAALAYAKAGQQVFCVGPRLQQMLTDTDVSKVPEDFLKFPYPCVYVATPDCPWEIFGGITGMHQVGGFYMYQKSARELLFAIWGKANENSQTTDDDATFWLLLDLDKVPRTSDTTGVTLMDFEAYLNQVLSDASADASDPALQVDPEDAIATAKDAMFPRPVGLEPRALLEQPQGGEGGGPQLPIQAQGADQGPQGQDGPDEEPWETQEGGAPVREGPCDHLRGHDRLDRQVL